MMTLAIPAWDDWWFYFYFAGYAVALTGLLLSRSRRLDYVFLVWAIAINLLAGSNVLPNSEFGKKIGLSFSEQQQPTNPQ